MVRPLILPYWAEAIRQTEDVPIGADDATILQTILAQRVKAPRPDDAHNVMWQYLCDRERAARTALVEEDE